MLFLCWVFMNNCSDNRYVSSPWLNVAHVDSAPDEEIAGETPSGAPGVADNPVRSGRNGGCGRSGTVSDDNDGVIDVIFVSNNTSRIAVDTGSLETESINNKI